VLGKKRLNVLAFLLVRLANPVERVEQILNCFGQFLRHCQGLVVKRHCEIPIEAVLGKEFVVELDPEIEPKEHGLNFNQLDGVRGIKGLVVGSLLAARVSLHYKLQRKGQVKHAVTHHWSQVQKLAHHVAGQTLTDFANYLANRVFGMVLIQKYQVCAFESTVAAALHHVPQPAAVLLGPGLLSGLIGLVSVSIVSGHVLIDELAPDAVAAYRLQRPLGVFTQLLLENVPKVRLAGPGSRKRNHKVNHLLFFYR
jgi:hypothetical protein